MQELFVPYELAVKLRDLGFDEKCLYEYVEFNAEGASNASLFKLCPMGLYGNFENKRPAFLFEQAFDWFRNRKGLISYIRFTMGYGWDAHSYHIIDTSAKLGEMTHKSKLCSYEEAHLACLEKLIELSTKNI